MKRINSKVRYFHASPNRIKVGTVLTAQEKSNFPGMKEDSFSPIWGVFMTTSEVPHYTVLNKAMKDGWHVYEVRPLTQLFFGTCWNELVAEKAEVIRYVGSARGIFNRYGGKYLNLGKQRLRKKFYGSSVYARQVTGKAKYTGRYRYVSCVTPSRPFCEEKDFLINKISEDPELHKRHSFYERMGVEIDPTLSKRINLLVKFKEKTK